MFYGASVFNQDISGWDVSRGIDFVSLTLIYIKIATKYYHDKAINLFC